MIVETISDQSIEPVSTQGRKGAIYLNDTLSTDKNETMSTDKNETLSIGKEEEGMSMDKRKRDWQEMTRVDPLEQ